MKLRDIIKATIRQHLDNDGLMCCQNLTGVGALNNTFPVEYNHHPGVIELPTSDVSNSGIAVGMSLTGRRVIYAIRFGGFLWLNASYLTNYAAKSQTMWNVNCPVFTRVLNTEGAIGPVAGNLHHGLIMRMPGIRVYAPMTPGEWQYTWDAFMMNQQPVLCSEHRSSYDLTDELPDQYRTDAQITIFAISAARLNAVKVLETLSCNLIHVVQLKPYSPDLTHLAALSRSKRGLVVDGEYETCGAAEHIAGELMRRTGVPVHVLGLEERCAGFAPHADNLTPSPERIYTSILTTIAIPV